MELSQGLTLFLLILLFRIGNSIFIISYIDPDEYWQSIEVAYGWIYPEIGGKGLTWEWITGIRSAFFPLIVISPGFAVLKLLGLDKHFLLMKYAPRVIMSIIASLSDFILYTTVTRLWGYAIADWSLLVTLLSHFNFIYSTRASSNSMETFLCVLAFYLWPWNIDKRLEDFNLRVFLAFISIGIGTFIRPTLILVWIIPAIHLFLSVIGIGLYVDFLFYHRWIFTFYNFFKLNIQEGVSSFYGCHPFLWYFYGAIPVLAGPFLPFFLYGCKFERKLLLLIFPLILVLSFVPHKEFRFIQPVLPFINVIAAIGLYNLFRSSNLNQGTLKVCIIALFCVSAILSVLYTRAFSTASLAVTHFLHKEKGVNNILFLNSHSCPLYAGVFRSDVHLDYIRMEPPFLLNYSLGNRFARPSKENERQILDKMSCERIAEWIDSHKSDIDYIVTWEFLLTKCPRSFEQYKIIFSAIHTLPLLDKDIFERFMLVLSRKKP